MRVVAEDQSAVEDALRAGHLRCPSCGGPLRPWGTARPREIRVGAAGTRAIRPRRGRCGGCGATHVLVPDWILARRADAAPVIWSALAAHARGLGYRRIAQRLRRPEATVRGWLRSFRRSAPRLLGALAPPRLPGARAADRASVAAAVRAVERVARTVPAWWVAVQVSGGLLVVNTNRPHVSGSARLVACSPFRWAVQPPSARLADRARRVRDRAAKGIDQ
jgi:hypothetical protein